MPPDPTTAAHGCHEGVALVLRAQDAGDWRPVADWLARHPECAAEVARFIDSDREVGDAAEPTPDPPRAGDAAGGYELREEIGRGAMGVVYRAVDPALRREVAVKVVRAGGPLAATEAARFRFEAEVVASLDHPNVVPVLAYGEAAGGPYLVMPLMPGGSLADRLREGGPGRAYTPDEAAGVVRALALGVHHAHQRGLIHRDLKPGNVLLDRDGAPRVADFGLARRVDATATASAGIAGTVAYMAPEQARGDGPLTTAVDVHALGAILFELLTGRAPYGGDVPGILRKLTDLAGRAPAVVAHRPDVPADLAAVCDRCLERDPTRRYGTAQELADELSRFLHREPVRARPRGLLDEVGAVVARPAAVEAYVTLPGVVFAVVHHPLVHLTIAGLLLAGAPAGWAYGVMAYFLAAWLGQVWWFQLRRHRDLNEVERLSVGLHLGLWASVVSLVPVLLCAFGPDVAPLYPVLNVVTAAAFFATGFFAGRQYVLGLAMLGQNLVLPFLPPRAWPVVHALSALVLFALFGLYLRQVHHAAVSADTPPADLPPSP